MFHDLNLLWQKLEGLLMGSYAYIAISLILSSCVIFYLTRRFVVKLVHRTIGFHHPDWVKQFDRNKTFIQLAYLAPVLLVYFTTQYFPRSVETIIHQFLNTYIALNLTLFITRLLRSVDDIYNLYPVSKDRPIRGYIQFISLLIYIIGGVITISFLLDKDPTYFFTGAVASSFVVTLIFQDTIKSLYAGIQITSQQLIKKGDWVEFPGTGADGTVIDVALQVIRVQNFDKTIVTIPTSKFITSSFRNYRGMYDAGMRRIKRSLVLDQTKAKSVSLSWAKKLLSKSIFSKEKDDVLEVIENAHDGNLTNLTLFREYVKAYLRHHPKIAKDGTLLVRLLEPTPNGICLQLYVFVNSTVWADYEAVQSQIFEHLLSALPEFDLSVFQLPDSNFLSDRVKG